MVKQLVIAPQDARRRQTVEIAPIPVNTYNKTLSDELADGQLSNEDASKIYRDMVLIRRFEEMLGESRGGSLRN